VYVKAREHPRADPLAPTGPDRTGGAGSAGAMLNSVEI